MELTEKNINQAQASRKLDALVSEFVFNNSCLGWAICGYADGVWPVHSDCDEVGWGRCRYAGDGPIRRCLYLDCTCNSIKDRKDPFLPLVKRLLGILIVV